MTPTDWIQLGSLILALVTLVYLIRYAGYTKLIAEATSKPLCHCNSHWRYNKPSSAAQYRQRPGFRRCVVSFRYQEGREDFLHRA